MRAPSATPKSTSPRGEARPGPSRRLEHGSAEHQAGDARAEEQAAGHVEPRAGSGAMRGHVAQDPGGGSGRAPRRHRPPAVGGVRRGGDEQAQRGRHGDRRGRTLQAAPGDEHGHRGRGGRARGPAGERAQAEAAYAVTRNRLAGYRDAIAAAGLEWSAAPVMAGVTSSAEEGAAAAAAPLDLAPAPTAILCMSDRLAEGAMPVARARGLAGPGDVSVVGFDDAPPRGRSG